VTRAARHHVISAEKVKSRPSTRSLATASIGIGASLLILITSDTTKSQSTLQIVKNPPMDKVICDKLQYFCASSAKLSAFPVIIDLVNAQRQPESVRVKPLSVRQSTLPT
jgi:hypothetical protein